MNIALALGQDNKAVLLYDEPLGFAPAWIESSEDGRGMRIIGEGGEEYLAGVLFDSVFNQLQDLSGIMMVRMENNEPVESHTVSFVNQTYKDDRS
ncbi:MAG: hypothetical protein KA155_01430 [Alphaproteobacteria bacterium]|jgi:hypothetical protein|nr:hypothetical protein [Alphaproteobacteria bacterium]